MESEKLKPSLRIRPTAPGTGSRRAFFVLEKTGGSQTNHINESNIIIQSNGTSLASAASMNEEIKAAMFNAITLDYISRVELNGDYNYTDSASKQYRYQSVFVITHY